MAGGEKCDGSVISIDSECCHGDKFVPCPDGAGKCANFGGRFFVHRCGCGDELLSNEFLRLPVCQYFTLFSIIAKAIENIKCS